MEPLLRLYVLAERYMSADWAARFLSSSSCFIFRCATANSTGAAAGAAVFAWCSRETAKEGCVALRCLQLFPCTQCFPCATLRLGSVARAFPSSLLLLGDLARSLAHRSLRWAWLFGFQKALYWTCRSSCRFGVEIARLKRVEVFPRRSRNKRRFLESVDYRG